MNTCRDCGTWVYWADVEKADGTMGRAPFDEPRHETLHWVTCAANVYVTDVLGNTYRVTRCSKCRRSIYWEKTARGKNRPMDVWLEEDDTPHAAGECHFETCTGQPTGDNWRQREYDRSRREGYERTRRQQDEQRRQPKQPSYSGQVPREALEALHLDWPVTLEQVTSAFRQYALVTHPDMGGSDAAFIAVKRAYDALKAVVK